MSKKYKRNLTLIGVVLLLAISLVILGNKYKDFKENNVIQSKIDESIDNKENQNNEANNRNEEEEIFQGLDTLSSWVVYWDLNVDKEIKQLENKLSSISYFAANFNDKNNLEVPKDLLTYYNDTKDYSFKKYITIVNDVLYDNGKSSVKDKEVLNVVLKDETSRSNHVNEIINLAKEYNFDGIEIDYEQIKDDLVLWNNFILFIKELYNKTSSNNLELSVLLEPNAPIEKLEFIEGPTYVMMAYNLHGAFSSPGEKANEDFIKELIEKMKKIEGNKVFALATGGFDWEENGVTKAVTEAEANEILSKYNIEAQRDDNSKYLYFNYVDEDNIKHEVWYADSYTLEYLSKPILEEGYDVSLWRLGGNL